MKSRIPSVTLFAALVGFSAAALLEAAPFPKKTQKVRDVATHDDLSQKLRMAQQKDPLRELGPAVGKSDEDPSKKNQPEDFIQNSTVLSYRGSITFIPKRAILHLPEAYEDRMKIEKGAKVTTFQQFFNMNRGWIRTMEVSREQAMGHKPFPEKTVQAMKNSSSVVVATYKQGPISVLPQKAPEDVPQPSELKPKTYAQ